MTKQTLLSVLTVSVALIAGCAGPGAKLASDPVPVALAPAPGLAGTWSGSFDWFNAFFYTDYANCVLQIRSDDTFTETCTPGKTTNNFAKASTLSGTVVTSRNRVTLRTSQGPSITLIRSGNTLYGVAEDSLTEETITIRFDREDTNTAVGRAPDE
jgi:hypothetical protein